MKKKDRSLIIRQASFELMGLIHNYIHEREELHDCGMTAVAYALELILSQGDKD